MSYNFSQFKQGADGTIEWLKKEYLGIRSNQANPGILDSVRVDMYGSKMPINQVASVLGESARSLRITPWDKSAVKMIDSAIREANLGVSVSVDDQGLRVAFPELTDDRRQALAKLAKQKLEEARVRVRNEREKVHSDADRQEKEGSIGKDDVFRAKQDLQKMVDETNQKLEELYEKKTKEISE
ncbi:MAG: Ribosome-recycling factor [Parcubacteria group bacterium GW2011_GWB1_49_7]|uniref:Ribosome recycling factor n=1 Tax=Candidatus Zambryskibacteria bacterium RIFCSPHIGHO2_01_FULL_46_25 TaxID=1802738 RepID=A0A1G2T097_9BACT|nr:MAG: Ribosome-recycling factor [Parcubacteria group bacterium GW2011_GWB1_49_7]OHA90418.1 MAG: ribosome recycling factor [Candidatus Zambryskibacteria bacterium RIFCSPHIGHO2_01_FULL_46_25]OHB02187.1 MAG: ribosome recycling factor [Candidatus Zambryskibacteria bacterium RIFCSPHIGHO2_12_FULL_48_10]OHB06956.1 MAG: ribosome recycling factor [Candidatus Zambryskibacteria bacterium RIFCSPLOWO2_01_FULL_48_25]